MSEDKSSEIPLKFCCAGMKGYLEKGWVKARPANSLTPNRIFFIIEVRGMDIDMILFYCLSCGKHVYPEV